MEEIKYKITPEKSSAEKLPPLPFTYQKVEDQTKARYIIEAKDDEEALKKAKERKEKLKWNTSEYWREKGIPQEQWTIQINGKEITIYNFKKEKTLSQNHIGIIQKSIKEMVQRFPQVLDHLNFILFDDRQRPSLYDDEEKFPLNGLREDQNTFSISPRGMRLDIPHRISSVSNFQGTLIHELAHFVECQFLDKWVEKFQWRYYKDNPDWEEKEIKGKKKWVNKKTGEVAISIVYPLEPEKCVSEYAKISMQEDICESVVAYIFDPEKLRKIAPEKYEILKSYDTSLKKERKREYQISIKKEKEVKLPEIQPETITYYVKKPEPESNLT